MSTKLAVIIPAYKSDFFESALNSLATQTNKNFSVYIGDDYSTNDLKSICDKFSQLLDIQYTRFEKNIGAKNLVHQWTRCVNLSKGEDWLWLFSDDDIAENNCVEKFYETLAKEGENFDVFRFNTNVINQLGEIISNTLYGPPTESSEAMAYNLLLGKRGNSMPDHVFSRKIYYSTGGFVYTQFAQAADWATSIKFSKNKGIYIIPEAKLSWRYSGKNISSLAGNNRVKMSKGYFTFVSWISHHFLYLKKNPSNISYEGLMEANLDKLRTTLIDHYGGVSMGMVLPLVKLLKSNFNMSFIGTLKFIFQLNSAVKKR